MILDCTFHFLANNILCDFHGMIHGRLFKQIVVSIVHFLHYNIALCLSNCSALRVNSRIFVRRNPVHQFHMPRQLFIVLTVRHIRPMLCLRNAAADCLTQAEAKAMGRVASAANSGIHPKAMEETENQAEEPDEAGRTGILCTNRSAQQERILVYGCNRSSEKSHNKRKTHTRRVFGTLCGI